MSHQMTGSEEFADVALLVRAFQISKMLQVAAALDLADRVANGPQPVARLALDFGVVPEHAPALVPGTGGDWHLQGHGGRTGKPNCPL